MTTDQALAEDSGPRAPSRHRPTAPDHAARRRRVRDRLGDHGVDALLVTAPSNVRYLTGFTGSNGQVLLTPDHELLITDARYDERAGTEAPDLDRTLARDWVAEAVDQAAAAGCGALGFEAAHVSWRDGERLRERGAEDKLAIRATTNAVESLRAVKDAVEVAWLTEACQLTVDAFAALVEHVAPGMTEREVARWLERTMVDLGAEAAAFPSIVASGPHSAIPHHEPTGRSLGRGDVLKLDFGARVAGYHADMTRVVAFGAPDPRLMAVHDLVAAAQERGRLAATAGSTAGDVDAACRGFLDDAGHGEHFVHGTGHGVGLDIHEAPAVSKDSAATLEPGTALTVEPGVYLPGLGGIRIEDTVVVTNDGPPRRLTTAPYELLRL